MMPAASETPPPAGQSHLNFITYQQVHKVVLIPAGLVALGTTAGRPLEVSSLQRAQIVPLACLEPIAKGLHITRWSREDPARQGQWAVCVDEMLHLQVLERQPIRRAVPRHPEQQEFDYARHGTVTVLLF